MDVPVKVPDRSVGNILELNRGALGSERHAKVSPRERRNAARKVASDSVDATKDPSWPADETRKREMAADCKRLMAMLGVTAVDGKLAAS